jgi:phytoene synthase
MNTDEAYQQCEQITWEQARNFAYGIRLLPRDKRRALAAVYAFARRIDDIGDGDLPPETKTAQLEQARDQVHALVAATKDARDAKGAKGGGSADGNGVDDNDPVLVALVDSGTRFDVPLIAFTELIDGCLADVNQASYKTFDDLLWYCRCVAGSIGRLSLGIYGTSGDATEAARLADSLGVALQLTNILRDVREDFQNGRVYLPSEDLAKFDCVLDPAGETPPPGPGVQAQFIRLMEFESDRARDWYATGLRLLPMLDWRSAACTGAMAGIYRRLLDRIAAQPAAVLRGRVSLSAGEKAVVAVKALAGRVG